MTKEERDNQARNKNTVTGKPNKTSRTNSKPKSELQLLATAVNFCIGFRIQCVILPKGLHISAETAKLAENITALQAELKLSLRADYERQRDNIFSKRKAK